MIEESNPFSKPAPAAGSNFSPGDAQWAWIAAGFLAVGLIVVSILWLHSSSSISSLKSELDEANTNLANSVALEAQDKAQIAALQSQIVALQAQAADLQKEKDSVAQNARSLEDEMRSDLQSKDVTISKLQGKLTVNILDRVMFNSGEASVKPEGQAVLRQIAQILAAHPELKIHVVGHTDNVPIHGRFASNWELSTARALAAVHFLTEQAGVDPRRVGAVGYGEFRPIADNATEEGRAKNRRIAITILSDELAGADTAPVAAVKETARPQAPATPATPAAQTVATGPEPPGVAPSPATIPAGGD